MKDSTATRFDCITFQEVLEKRLRVMDASAISLCRDNNVPIIVFNMRTAGNIARVVRGAAGVGDARLPRKTVNRES
jgi:uridylate kinase